MSGLRKIYIYTTSNQHTRKMTDISKASLEQQERVLTENCTLIINLFDADDVINELIQARMISDHAAQRIGLVTMTTQDKNRIIFDQLSTAGPGALEKLCDILKKKKRQAYIADILEKSKAASIRYCMPVKPCIAN